jgi:hypothetical protein
MIKESIWDGKPISKPGVYSGVPIEVYHSQAICAGTSVSSSGLRRILEENGGSPAHFWCEWDGNPEALEPEEKAHFALGKAAHHLFLGEKLFYDSFIIRPAEIADEHGVLKPWQGNRTVCKQWTEQARATGRTILSVDQVEVIKAMARQLVRYAPQGSPIRSALTGLVERTIIWRDEETGLWIKTRPDVIPTHSGEFVDLKTTNEVHYHDLERAFTEYGYAQQMALIREGARVVLKMTETLFALLFIMKKAPWWPRIMELKPEALDIGHKLNRKALKLLKECLAKKDWPGPGGYDVSFIDVQDWYRKRVERQP